MVQGEGWKRRDKPPTGGLRRIREKGLLNLKSPRASSTSSVGILEKKQKIRIGPEANQPLIPLDLDTWVEIKWLQVSFFPSPLNTFFSV